MIRIFAAVFLLMVLLPSSTFSGRQENGLADTPEGDVVNEVAIDSGTLQLNQLAIDYPDTGLMKRFHSGDAERYLLSHFGLPLKISVFDKGNFLVRWTREFSADDLDDMADDHPDLLKYVTDFPTTSGDNNPVKLKIETVVTYDLADETEFESTYPELFRIYNAFRDAPICEVRTTAHRQVASRPVNPRR